MNIFKKLFSAKNTPPARRTLPQRISEAEENIEQLWKSLGLLSSDVGTIAGRLDTLEQASALPLPDGYEWQTDPETGEDVIVFGGGEESFESYEDFGDYASSEEAG